MTVNPDARLGTELFGYRIEALIGRGGMGIVYRAEHLRLHRTVALKLLSPELAKDQRFRDRFLRESELAASLDHPNVIPIFDAGEAESTLFLAMRYVDGSDLRSVLEREGSLQPARALSVIAQVASGLDAAHARGLVHRDVKPGNVLVAPGAGGDAEDHCYLCDFGLTKMVSSVSGLTATGQFMGTLDYVAPEQIRGERVDGRADLYSLGCVLFECLTGATPYKRDTEVATLWAHVQEKPPSLSEHGPDLPRALDHVVERALAKAPEKRFATCREFARAAQAAFEGPQMLSPRAPRKQWMRRRTLAIALASLAVAGGGTGAVLALVGNGEEPGGTAGAPAPAAPAAGSETPKTPALRDPPTILPGRSIGLIRLGMAEAEVVDLLGEPTAGQDWSSGGRIGSTATYRLHDERFRVSYFNGKVVAVATGSSYYKTASGIRVDSEIPSPNDEEARRSGAIKVLEGGAFAWRDYIYETGPPDARTTSPAASEQKRSSFSPREPVETSAR